MTDDLISRRAAVEAIRKEFIYFSYKDADPIDDTVEAVVQQVRDGAAEIIEDLPSAQPEIIRCKDCKFYTPMNRETKTGICRLLMHQNFGDDWYCAGAERRTDGNGRN